MKKAMKNVRPFLWLLAYLCLGSAGEPCALGNTSALFETSFDAASDVNYDDWPDRWERTNGLEYPHYTNIGIVSAKDTDDGHCLQIDLDGGGALLKSPAISILSKFGYALRLKLHAEGLEYTQVTVAIDLQDRHGKRLQLEQAPAVGNTEGWIEIQIGPFRPMSEKIDRAILRIDAPRMKRGDLHGRIRIDEIYLERLPSMIVTTGRVCNMYDKLDEIEIHCELSGIRDQNPEIRFQLLDATSRIIEGQESKNQSMAD